MTRMTRYSARPCRPCRVGASPTWETSVFIEFIADEAEQLVRVYYLVWTG